MEENYRDNDEINKIENKKEKYHETKSNFF